MDALLQTYNPIGTVFPTCKTNASTTAIDNLFIAKTKKYTIYAFINGLSDHTALILVIENIVLTKQRNNSYSFIQHSRYPQVDTALVIIITMCTVQNES